MHFLTSFAPLSSFGALVGIGTNVCVVDVDVDVYNATAADDESCFATIGDVMMGG